jgi:N-acetylneuraminic acid mutarotase
MIRRSVCAVSLLTLVACGDGENAKPADAGPGLAPTGTEESLEALPSVRQEHAVVALDGEIYVIGGFAPGATGTVAAYDPETNAWREVAGLPGPLHHANTAVVNGKIYVAGYYPGTNFSAVAGIFEYDPQQDAWSELGAMPAGTQRGAACVVALGGKIYVFGGANGGTVATASAYDPATDTWEELTPLPAPREHCVAGAIGGKLYIASGRSNGITGFEPETWEFDPASGTYADKAAIPTPRGGTAGAVLGGMLFVFGGEGNAADPDGVFPTIEAYDPAADRWTAFQDMSVPRHGFGAAELGGRIYLPGGADHQAFGAVDDHSVFY